MRTSSATPPPETDVVASVARLLRYEADIAFRRRARTIVEYLQPTPHDRILDAGCGLGFYLALLGRTCSSELHGLDVDAARLRTAVDASADATAQLVGGDVCDLPYRDSSFDKLILSEVLEHLDDDLPALRESYRVLRPGGVLAITVPHAGYPPLWDPPNYLRERLGLGHFRSEPWSGIWTDHRRLYTPASLRAAVEAAGLTVTDVRLETRHSFPFAHHIVYGLGKLLVERNLVGAKDGRPASRASFWADDQRLNLTRAMINVLTAPDHLNRERYESGPAVSLCLRAVRSA